MKLELGQTVITKNALETLNQEDVQIALRRHENGDWGNVPEEDKIANDQDFVDGESVKSSYSDRNQKKFWIITEGDRSVNPQ